MGKSYMWDVEVIDLQPASHWSLFSDWLMEYIAPPLLVSTIFTSIVGSGFAVTWGVILAVQWMIQ